MMNKRRLNKTDAIDANLQFVDEGVLTLNYNSIYSTFLISSSSFTFLSGNWPIANRLKLTHYLEDFTSDRLL